MINSSVPRRFGLDESLLTVMGSGNPLRDLVSAHTFLPSVLLGFAKDNRGSSVEQILEDHPLTPPPVLKYFSTDGDYITKSAPLIATLFEYGVPEFHYADRERDSFNPSFNLTLLPRETMGILKKVEMLQQSIGSEYDSQRYDHVKTLALTDGSRVYLAVVSGRDKVDFRSAARAVGRSSLRFLAKEHIKAATGRELGAVSPLLYDPCFGNIAGVLFAENLLSEGYAQPHYELVLDRRSALMVSDMNDVKSILEKRTKGVFSKPYPAITVFNNRSS